MAMRVLIAGGAGFVGANVATYLARQAEDYQVTVMDNLVRLGSEFNLTRLREAGIPIHRGDIRCREDFPKGPFDLILDCAAQPSAIDGYDNPVFDFTNNTWGVLNLLEKARAWKAGIIFWASNKVYPASAVGKYLTGESETRMLGAAVGEDCPLDGHDRSLYGASKIMADLMIQEYCGSFGVPYICNRFSCLAGPWQWGKVAQGWVAWWVIAHEFGLPLRYIGYHGKQVRDVLFVDDLCALIDLQAKRLTTTRPVYWGAYNVGGGPANACSLIEMTRMCEEVTGKETEVTVESTPRRADFAWYVSDIGKVSSMFNWRPGTDIRLGTTQIHNWVLEHRAMLGAMYCHKEART